MTHSNSAPGGMALYRRLLAYVRPLLPAFMLSVLGFCLYGGAGVWFFDLLGDIVNSIDAGLDSSNTERLQYPLSLMALVLLRGVGGFLGSYSMAWLAQRVVFRLRSEIMQSFLRTPLSFHERQTSGHLVSTVTFNVAQVTSAVSDSITVLLREGGMVVFLVGYLLYLNWQLTLVFIAVTPLISAVVVFASRHLRRYSRRIQISMGDVTQVLTEGLKGLKVIRTFGAEQQVLDSFNSASEHNMRQNLKLQMTSAISSPVIHLLVAGAISILLWLAMAPEALSSFTPGGFVAYMTAAGYLLQPIRQTSKVNAEIQKGLAAATSIFALLDERAEVDTGSHSVARVQGKVEYRRVRFSYKTDGEPVIDGLNLLCEPGKTVAIVGRSGSGKSTLVNLLPRFYDIQAGEILVDDLPHTEYTLANLRGQIALVSQQVVLFNGTIRDNIAYGDLASASEADIEAALTHANAMEFIRELPQGLDTRVGDDGLLLSGGQRQRLAIARALLKDAPILILDEATSALDTASERYIQTALERLMQGRTTLVIAHRLSTIEKADVIVVLDKGRIVESGSHAQLLARAGTYAALHRMQFTEVVSE